MRRFLSFRSHIHCRQNHNVVITRQTVSGHGSNAFPEICRTSKLLKKQCWNCESPGWVIRILESSSQLWCQFKNDLWFPNACPDGFGRANSGGVVLLTSVMESNAELPKLGSPNLSGSQTCSVTIKRYEWSYRSAVVKGLGSITVKIECSVMSHPKRLNHRWRSVQRVADGLSLV